LDGTSTRHAIGNEGREESAEQRSRGHCTSDRTLLVLAMNVEIVGIGLGA